jgi:hypothetical protein
MAPPAHTQRAEHLFQLRQIAAMLMLRNGFMPTPRSLSRSSLAPRDWPIAARLVALTLVLSLVPLIILGVLLGARTREALVHGQEMAQS